MAGNRGVLVFGIERRKAGDPEITLFAQALVVLDQLPDAFMFARRQQAQHMLGHEGIAPVSFFADVVACAHAVKQSFSLIRLRRSQVRIVFKGTA